MYQSKARGRERRDQDKARPNISRQIGKALKGSSPNPTDIFQKDYGELLKIFEENYLMVEANARVYKS